MNEKQARAAMLADLARSGLVLEDVRGWTLAGAEELKRHFPKAGVEWAYRIPYPMKHRQGCAPVCRYRVLSWQSRPFGAEREKPPKYLQPPKSPPGAFFYAQHDWKVVLEDTAGTLVLVEGEKKAIAGCKAGHHVVGLGGVWSWKCKAAGVGLLTELAALPWLGRTVYLCFDSDAAGNLDVARALRALADTLTSLGALVATATMPELKPGAKTGLDDFVVARGPGALTRHLDACTDRGELAARLWEFNERFAVVHEPAIVIDEAATDDLGHSAPRLLNPQTFKNVLMVNAVATTVEPGAGPDAPAKKVKVADKWLGWPARRQYQRLTYAPGEPAVLNCGSRVNAWRGLGVAPKKGDVRPWQKLLAHMFKEGTPEQRLWFERWLGWPLKFPGAKLASAVGVWGKPGRGKSIIAEKTLGPIYGRNFTSISQQDLEGSFNGWAVNRQFVLVDEVSAEDSRTRGHRFKKMITQTDMQVNVKFIPGYVLPDHVNYYMTSNSARAFHVEDDDRRFFIHRVPDDALPPSFWADYVERWIGYQKAPAYGPGPAALLYYFLEELDYGDFDPSAPPPMTSSKAEMIEIARHPCEDWLRHYCETEHFRQRKNREVYSVRELCLVYRGSGPRGADGTSVNVFGAHVAGAGLPRRQVRIGDEPMRLVAVTNVLKWDKAKPDAWAKELCRTGEHGEKF